MANSSRAVCSILLLVLGLVCLPLTVSAECNRTCEQNNKKGEKTEALKFKVAAIVTILAGSVLGVLIPVFCKKISFLAPGSSVFFLIKAFAAGVILSTGFVHVLPEASHKLTNPCLNEHPWSDFPFTGFIAMLSAIMTMMIDAFATSYYKRWHFKKSSLDNGNDVEMVPAQHEGHLHVHTHATHGHAHGPGFASVENPLSDLFRHRVVSQVLELGIVVHSVIIGISLGASTETDVVKPLVAALTFHQFFEGMGLGGCITQAKFKYRAVAIMALLFSLTTPVSIGIGIGISESYNENDPAALIVQGVFNAAAAGILIYMALVDLLAEDFMNPDMQANVTLQIGASISLLLGIGCMSVLAYWA
uniref:Uncharacterized protein MANES_03G075600 n=2 Tax=Rhizophora mucronata TaxID=61149 RepID=A0A2P2KDN4_RHIMU